MNNILILIGLIIVLIGLLIVLFGSLTKGPVYATIHYKDGHITQVSRVFNTLGEFDDWEDEVLHTAETCNTEDDAIDYIEYSFVDPLNKK